MILALLLACAPKVAPPVAAAEHVDRFALAGHGHAFGGLAIVVHDGPDVTLEALSPAGPAIFTVVVAGGNTAIDAADPGMAAMLGRLPFARDLTALYLADCAQRCAVGAWTVRPTRDGWRVAGEGGPARVTRGDGTLVLRDRLRGYTLTVWPGEPR